jgi:endoglucanase
MKRMNKGLASLLSAMALLAPGAVAPAATPWLHVSGNTIQDPHGNVVTLRGVAVLPQNEAFYCHYCFDQQIPVVIDQTCDATNGWFSRAVRITVTKADSLTPAAEFANNIDPLVQECVRKGLYAIVDLHFISDYGTGRNAVSQTTVMNFWNYVAPRYANTPNVIFELFNEPKGPADWNAWKTYIQPVVNAVRAVAPNNLILMGSPNWSTFTNNAVTSPISGSNIVYVYHIYPNQGAPTTALLDSKFGTAANTVPVYVTEFGWEVGGGNVVSGTTSAWGVPFRTYMDAHPNISWSAFIFSDFWHPIMFDHNWNLLGGDSFQGQTIKDWLAAKQNDHQPVP